MKNILHIIICLLLLNLFSESKAQQVQLFNHYSLDPVQINIAYTGKKCSYINLHYRDQWTGFKDAPSNVQINANHSLSDKHGVILRVGSMKAGLLSNLQANLGYVYKHTLNKNASLHVGLGLGLLQTSLSNQNAIVLQEGDENLSNQKSNKLDSEIGLAYLGNKLSAGFSAQHLYTSNTDAVLSYKQNPQFNTHISYLLVQKRKLELEPFLLHRYTVGGKQQMEGILKATFRKLLIAGVGYRNYGTMVLLGLKYTDFTFAYSFDYGIFRKSIPLGSSHQIMLGYKFCRRTPEQKEQDKKAEERLKLLYESEDQKLDAEKAAKQSAKAEQKRLEAEAEAKKKAQEAEEKRKASEELTKKLEQSENQNTEEKPVLDQPSEQNDKNQSLEEGKPMSETVVIENTEKAEILASGEKADEEKKAILAAEEKRLAEDEMALKAAEEQAIAKAEEEKKAVQAAEEKRLADEAMAKKSAEEQAKAKAEEEKKAAQAAEEKRLADEAIAKKATEEQAKAKAEEEKKATQAAEEKRLADEAMAKKSAEEQAKAKAEEEKKAAQAAEENRLADEAMAKKLAEEQAKAKAEEEKRAAQAAEEKRIADEEMAKKSAEEQAKAKAEEEKKAAQAAEEKRLADEAMAKKSAEGQAKAKAEEEKRAAQAAEEKRIADEAMAKKSAEEQAKAKAEEEKKAAQAEAKRKQDEVAAKQAEEKRLAEEKAELEKKKAAKQNVKKEEKPVDVKPTPASEPTNEKEAAKSATADIMMGGLKVDHGDVLAKINQLSEEIMFPNNKTVLSEHAKSKLDQIAAILKETDLKFSIVGYTCDYGTAEYNKALSEDRALIVKRYLKKQGVSPGRFLNTKYTPPTGYLYPNDSAIDRAKNRTVRFELVK